MDALWQLKSCQPGLGLYMVNPPTTFQVFIFIGYEDIKGDAKCRTWGVWGHLAFHSNYVPILHRFWDIARYWSKIVDFNLPHLDEPIRISPRSMALEN